MLLVSPSCQEDIYKSGDKIELVICSEQILHVSARRVRIRSLNSSQHKRVGDMFVVIKDHMTTSK